MGDKKKSKGCCGWFIVAIVLAVLVVAVVFLVRSKMEKSDKAEAAPRDAPEAAPGDAPEAAPEGDAPGAAPGEATGALVQKYGDALKLAMQFFDIQKSGKLENNNIPWRGDSALDDGEEAKLDLSKGMFDAGDHIKFGFPMAFTATVLSWSILEYGDRMKAANQLGAAQDSLKWITDYLAAAHPSDNVLYIQVGDAEVDHGCWERPEAMNESRPLIQINTTAPGSEVAAETAAALASASLVFKSTSPDYSETLLEHAKTMFAFADKYRKSYSVSVPEVENFYNSTGFADELLWAAGWLYHATGDDTYFAYTERHGNAFANFGSPTWFSWDNKLAAVQVLLSRVSFFGGKDKANSAALQEYRKTAEAVMCGLLPGSPSATSSRTHGGLIWVSERNALQHPVAASFLAVLYSDYMLTSQTGMLSCDGKTYKPSDLRDFAISQADYVLGNNPMKLSYLVGYGDNYPVYVHHRGASIPADATTGCKDGWKWLDSEEPNPNIAYGALVGGPFLNETYIDSRNNSMQGEPTTYNTALMVGLLSGLVTTSSVVQSFT